MSDLGNKNIMAKNIKRYMDINNKERSQVCTDLGFKYSTFSEWLNGNKYPRIDKIEIMANYFRINKSDLVEEYHPNTQSEDEKDITAIIEQMRERLTRNDLTFEGKPVTQEEIQSILAGLQVGIEMARKRMNDKK